jgi:hypothetical protein
MEPQNNGRKVVVAPDISLVDVMLVETLGYNLLGKTVFAVFIDNEIVVLLWSKSLNVAFIGVMGLINHPGILKLWAIAHNNGPKMEKR